MDDRTDSTVLLVEGDKIQAAVEKDFLEARGYCVIHVVDGKSAIRAAKTRDIDLILLDLVLPDMSGDEVARWLRLNNDTKDIPIIALSSKGAAEEGAATQIRTGDRIADPYNEVELEAMIRESLRKGPLQDKTADTGDLAGLPDRGDFENALWEEFNKARGSSFSCMIVAIDNFSRLDEAYGRDAGDSLLVQTASLLKHSVRSSDVIAHMERGEFAILLTDTAAEDTAVVRDRILAAVASHKFSGLSESITVSIGIAGGPSADSPARLLREAQLALHKEKQRAEK